MMDFTIKRYSKLLHTLLAQGFLFLRVDDKVGSTALPTEKCIILRHDTDARPANSLRLARLEHALGIHGTYYFRFIPSVFDKAIIRNIAGMGHEIGYHYETMSFRGDLETKGLRDLGTERLRDKETGRVDRAYKLFVKNLEKFREIVPVTTICMHGSPLSRFDNRDIWKEYNYRDLGIVGDPYFDIDFSQVAYFTDTSRRWNGVEVSIRDKVEEKRSETFPSYRSTQDMIRAIEKGTFPEMAMLTIHPQRWNDAVGPWVQELIWQNLKNVAKRGLRIWRSRFAS